MGKSMSEQVFLLVYPDPLSFFINIATRGNLYCNNTFVFGKLLLNFETSNYGHLGEFCLVIVTEYIFLSGHCHLCLCESHGSNCFSTCNQITCDCSNSLEKLLFLCFSLQEKVSNLESENQVLRQQALAISPTGKAVATRPKTTIILVILACTIMFSLCIMLMVYLDIVMCV